MKEADAIRVLGKLGGTVLSPRLTIVDSFWQRGKLMRFQIKYDLRRDRILITKALLADLVSDHELAFVLGHELGHRTLHRNWFRNAFHRQEVEREADAYAIKLMREKGYNPYKNVVYWFDRRVYANTGVNRHKMAARRNAVRALIGI